MALHYKIFPLEVSGFGHAPRYHTTITVGGNANEARNADWQDPLRVYNAAFAVKTKPDIAVLEAFFHTVKGRWTGFLVKDYADYNFDYQILTGVDAADGSQTQWQIFKIYADALSQYVKRDIKFPKVGTVFVKVGGVLKTETTHYTVNYSTGIVTFLSAPAALAVIEVKCEFYVPVRFDTDELPIETLMFYVSAGAEVSHFEIASVPMIEIRNETVIGYS
jgi:uncharacterized protein (TIGR02217 family)